MFRIERPIPNMIALQNRICLVAGLPLVMLSGGVNDLVGYGNSRKGSANT